MITYLHHSGFLVESDTCCLLFDNYTENGKKAVCNVIVETSPQEITLNKTLIRINLNSSKTLTLTPKIQPSSANINNTLEWTSDNPKIAIVNDGVVKGIANGTTTIRVSVKIGNKKLESTCKVIVETLN